jgi:hypothetical protein
LKLQQEEEANSQCQAKNTLLQQNEKLATATKLAFGLQDYSGLPKISVRASRPNEAAISNQLEMPTK